MTFAALPFYAVKTPSVYILSQFLRADSWLKRSTPSPTGQRQVLPAGVRCRKARPSLLSFGLPQHFPLPALGPSSEPSSRAVLTFGLMTAVPIGALISPTGNQLTTTTPLSPLPLVSLRVNSPFRRCGFTDNPSDFCTAEALTAP